MADLFKDPLDTISLSDVLGFLAISAPETQRPAEGTRLDFKRELIGNLGFYVAALANTAGGLIFVGVESQKNTLLRQNVPTAVPGADLGSDARARITNKIVTTVSPRPEFDVEPYSLASGASGNAIAVIRVATGDYPPYEFAQSGDFSIPLRIQDTTRRASLREIEELIKTRDQLKSAAGQLVNSYLASEFLPKPPRRHQLVVVPLSPQHLRLDTASEVPFLQLLRSVFQRLGQTSERRGGTFYFVEFEKKRYASVWSSQALGFGADLSRRGHPGEHVGDIVEDLLLFCRTASEFYKRNGYFGQLTLAHEVYTLPVTLLTRWELAEHQHQFQSMKIPIPETTPHAKVNRIKRIVESGSLENPAELVSQLLLEQLREIWQAEVTYSVLLEEVRNA